MIEPPIIQTVRAIFFSAFGLFDRSVCEFQIRVSLGFCLIEESVSSCLEALYVPASELMVAKLFSKLRISELAA